VSQHLLALPAQFFSVGVQFGGSPCQVGTQLGAHLQLWSTTAGTRELLADRVGVEAGGEQTLYLTDNAAASDDLARRLNAELHIQPSAGHFLTEDGVSDLPLVLALMQR
jgi:hypothetical protein